MASGGKITNKRAQDHAKPYDRPKKSLLGRVSETVREMLTPSFLKVKPHARPVTVAQNEWSSEKLADSTVPQQIEVEMDGYVAMFDSSIIGEDTGTSKMNGQSLETHGVSAHLSRSNGTVTSRFSFSQLESTPRLTASPSLRNVAVSGIQPATASSHNPFLPKAGKSGTSCFANADDGFSESDSQPKIKRHRPDICNGLSSESSPVQPCASSSNDTCIDHNNSKQNLLWSSTTNTSQPTGTPLRKPVFNVSTFCTSVNQTRNDMSALSRSYQESPFYRGRTTYGGASAYSKRQMFAASPYHMVSSVARVKVRPGGGLDGRSGIMSSTARRIYEALERTSPTNAQRIHSANSDAVDSVLLFDTSAYRRNSLQPAVGTEKKGPPVKDLTTPTINLIAQSRSVFSNAERTTTSVGSSQLQESTPLSNDNDKRTLGGGGKMRREHSKHYSSNRNTEDAHPSLDYTLPSSVSLPPLKLATTSISFSIANTVSAVTSTAGSTSISSSQQSQYTVSSVSASSSSSTSYAISVASSQSASSFKFSVPLTAGDRSLSNKLVSPTCTFNFNKPLPSSSRCTVATSQEVTTSTNINVNSSTAVAPSSVTTTASSSIGTSLMAVPSTTLSSSSKLSDFKFDPSAAIKKKQINDPAECGKLSTASNLKQGSVLDILGSKPSSTEAERRSPAIQEIQSKTDSPSSKLLPTLSAVTTGTSSSTSAAFVPTVSTCSSVTTAPSQPSLSELFKQREAPGNWNCNECFVTNKSTDTRCPACTTPRPGVSPSDDKKNTPASAPSVTSSGFTFGTNGGFSFSASSVSSSQSNSPIKFGAVTSTVFSSGQSHTASGGSSFGVDSVAAPSLKTNVEGIQFGVNPTPAVASSAATVSVTQSTVNSLQFSSATPAKSTSETVATTASTFSFTGASTQTATQPASNSFVFGAPASKQSEFSFTASTSRDTVTSVGTSFGSSDGSVSCTSSQMTPFGKTEALSNAGPFKLGGGNGSFSSASSSSSSAFGVGTAVTCSSSSQTGQLTGSGFGFGSTSAAISASTSVAPGFLFAGTVSTSSTKTNSFTGPQLSTASSAMSQNTSSSLFTFGQQSAAAGSQRPLGVPASSTGVFQFGSSQAGQNSAAAFGGSSTSFGAAGNASATLTSSTTVSSAIHAPITSVASFGSSTGAFGASTGAFGTSVAPFGSSTGVLGGVKFPTSTAPTFSFNASSLTSSAATVATTSYPVFGASSATPSAFGVASSAPAVLTFGKPEASSVSFGPSTTTSAMTSAAPFGTVAASTAPFGFTSSSGTLFTFGASTAVTSSNTSSSQFAFGKAAVSAAQPAFGLAASAAFGSAGASFGQQLTSVSAASFMQPSNATTNVAPVFGQSSLFTAATTSGQTTGSFGFGGLGPPPSDSQKPFGQPSGTQQTSGSSAFGNSLPFGGASQNMFNQPSASNVFTFGASNVSSSTVSGTFAFGANSGSAGTTLGKRSVSADEEANSKKSLGFGPFGGASNSGSAFGSSAVSAPAFGAPAAASVFGFGTTQQPQAPWNNQPSNANPAPFSATPSFNFAQQAVQQQSQQPAVFQFAAQPSEMVAATVPATNARIIKKATRKLRK